MNVSIRDKPKDPKAPAATRAIGRHLLMPVYAALFLSSNRGLGQSGDRSTPSATAFQILGLSASPSSWSFLAVVRANLLAAVPCRTFKNWAKIKTARWKPHHTTPRYAIVTVI